MNVLRNDSEDAGLEPSHNDRSRVAGESSPDRAGGHTLPITRPDGSVITDRQVVRVDRQILYPEGQAGKLEPQASDRRVSAPASGHPTPGLNAELAQNTHLNDPPDYTPPPATSARQSAAAQPPRPGPREVPAQGAVAPLPTSPAAQNVGPVAVPPGAAGSGRPGPLFQEDELHNFRARWDKVQASFVDEPRTSVESADALVANVVKRIAEQFASEREALERQWDRGDSTNTEELRQAIKRYRAFFDRLLAF